MKAVFEVPEVCCGAKVFVEKIGFEPRVKVRRSRD